MPARAIPARRHERPTSDSRNFATSVQVRNKEVGPEHATFRVTPAKKGLDARKAIGFEVNGGLVHQEKLAPLKG
jgi:hypothetical protein